MGNEKSEKKVKIGIIGCGGIANGKHMPSLKQLDNVEMAAFCDIVEERAEKAAKEYGTANAKVYTDYREMIKDASIDAVHVCTPNRSHSFITIDSLEAGKHVMCEKPMAKTAADARAMVETAKKTGKLLTIGYQNRYRKDSMYLNKVCRRGDLGEIYMAKAHAIRRRAVPTWGIFLNEFEQGGGPLIDIGTHALDLTLWEMDNYDVKSVKGSVFYKLGKQTGTGNAWGDWDVDAMTVEDSAFALITMKNGATIFLESSWALNTLDVKEAKTSLYGTKAGADMDDGLRINRVDLGAQQVVKPDLKSGGVAFYDGKEETEAVTEARVWISAVTDGTPLVVKPEQALVVSEILEAVYESAKTGKTVEF
jgi:predicted dehydrogenase